MPSVLKDWVFELPLRMQSVLMSALRGCDTARKDDSSKFITRAIRSLLLNNADPTNSFIVGDGIPEATHVKAFLWDLDSYPLHFVMHTLHAGEILGYKHPEEKFRKWWHQFYLDGMKALHVNPEVESQLDIRLGHTPAEKEALGITPKERDFEEDWAELKRDVPKPPEEKPKKRKLSGLEEALKEAQREKQANPPWDAGTGTSHGGRNRPWSGGS